MPKDRAEGRKGKAKGANAQAGGFQPSPEMSLASASRLAVWKWWLDVFKAMLRLFGYSDWLVEGEGDCQLISFAAGHEITEPSSVSNPSASERNLLVTAGMRKPAVAFLTTGEATGYAAKLSDDEVAIVAAMNRLHTASTRATLTAMKAKLAPWLKPKHYGDDGYAILSALGVLKGRVCPE